MVLPLLFGYFGTEGFQIPEPEGGREGELEGGGGDEVVGGEGEEGGMGLAGEVAEAVPGGRGDLLKFAWGVELEVENEKREVAVAKEEVGAAERFGGVMTTDPEEPGAGTGIVGDRVEGVAAVNESKGGANWELGAGNREPGTGNWDQGWVICDLGWIAEQLDEDEGEAGGGTGGREFGEGSLGKGGQGGRRAHGFDASVLMGVGKLLAKLLAQ